MAERGARVSERIAGISPPLSVTATFTRRRNEVTATRARQLSPWYVEYELISSVALIF